MREPLSRVVTPSRNLTPVLTPKFRRGFLKRQNSIHSTPGVLKNTTPAHLKHKSLQKTFSNNSINRSLNRSISSVHYRGSILRGNSTGRLNDSVFDDDLYTMVPEMIVGWAQLLSIIYFPKSLLYQKSFAQKLR